MVSAWITRRWIVGAAAVAWVAALGACDEGPGRGDIDLGWSRPDAPLGDGPGADGRLDSGGDGGAGDVTVKPVRINDVLINPGMGFTSFHFGWWCNLPPISFTPKQCADRTLKNWPQNHPKAGTAYFRWYWSDLEPSRGKIDFSLIDTAIQSANLMGQTLAFRVMTIQEGKAGVPDWLTKPPYSVPGTSQPGSAGATFWPDYQHKTFISEHRRLITALGQRYSGHPAVDHVDVGTVGCWGEWNTACLTGSKGFIDILAPKDNAARQQIIAAFKGFISDHLAAFPKTPVVMLGLGSKKGEPVEIMAHAIKGGAGWRVDCWGDWGIFGTAWNHQTSLYPDMIANLTAAVPSFPDVWKQAPVQLEVCSTMPDWHSRGWKATKPDGKVYKTFQWALAQHAAVLNAKSTKIPADYLPAIQDLLRKNGYRFVVDSFNHSGAVARGAKTVFTSTWSNLGVTPSYLPRTLTYRLRGASSAVTFASVADIRAWLPGSWKVTDAVTIPSTLPPGTYQLELALLDRDGAVPATKALPPLQLGIQGRRADGWYPLSQLDVN